MAGLGQSAVLASVKVRNLKANHNGYDKHLAEEIAVLASVKVRNLKANHNIDASASKTRQAVLASVKVRNLKANHNKYKIIYYPYELY